MSVAGLLQDLSPDRAATFQNSYNKRSKSGLTAALLGLLFGGLGVHRFYRGEVARGVIYIITSVVLVGAVIAVADAHWSVAVVMWAPSAGWMTVVVTQGMSVMSSLVWLALLGWNVFLLADSALMPHRIRRSNAEMAFEMYTRRRDTEG